MKIILNIFIATITITIISYWLHSRIFREFFRIDLNSTNIENYRAYFGIMVSFSSYLLILMLIVSLYTYYNKEKTYNKKKLVTSFIFKLNKFIGHINIFYKTYVILFNSLGGEYTQYIIFLAKFVLTLKKPVNTIIIVSFVILPRVLIATILILEIYLGQLHYYFYSLLFLLVPILFRIILFMLKDIGPRSLVELKQIVKQTPMEQWEDILYETPEGVKKYKGIKFFLAPEHSDLDLDMVMYEYYYPSLFIEGHIEKNIYPLVNKLSKISLIIYYIITILGFTYILQI